MRKIYEAYVYLLDVKLKSNTFVIIIISISIIFTGAFLPKKTDLQNNCLNNQKVVYSK